jgi:hypothetical protein
VRENGSVTLDGPKGIPLRSGTVQTLAMVTHELVANAVKYGALKQPNGHLTVRWHLETKGEDGKPWLHVDWKESGVEMPRSPQATGQGRALIERALPYQFGAHTRFALEEDGIHCTAGAMIFDAFTPQVVSVTAVYVCLVLIGYWLRDKRSALALALLATPLIIIGHWISIPSDAPEWESWMNRSTSIGSVWLRYGVAMSWCYGRSTQFSNC